MRTTTSVLGLIATLGVAGCASTSVEADRGERDFSGATRRSAPSLQAGKARVLGTRVNPMAHERAATKGASRVTLDGGRFVVFWTRGSLEWGRRALAQAYNQDGSPRGAPVVISPPDADVMVAPRAVTTDGRHIVATFVAATGGSFELLSVPIEDSAPDEGLELAATR
jgi:hypothetical protein